MPEFIDSRPVLRFLAHVLGLVLLAGCVIAAAGLVLRWSSRVDYSDGFFFASVFFAAVGSIRSLMAPRAALTRKTLVEPDSQEDDAGLNWLERFFNRRSLDFKLMTSAAVCLLTSILIAQM